MLYGGEGEGEGREGATMRKFETNQLRKGATAHRGSNKLGRGRTSRAFRFSESRCASTPAPLTRATV